MRALSLLLFVACAPVVDDRPDFDGDGIPDAEDPDADGDGIPDDEDDFVDLDADGFDRLEDCDDADPAVNPSAEEICGNGKDDDCDGSAVRCRLEGDVDIADSAASYVTGEESGDGLGNQVVLLDDAGEDGFADVLVGAARVGRAWRFAGIEAGALSTRRAVEVYAGDDPGYATSVSGGPDLTGQGRIDVVLGQPGFSDGGRAGIGRIEIRGVGAEAPVQLIGRSTNDAIGAVTHVLGDLDRDGRSDLWTRVGEAPSLVATGPDGGGVSIVLQVRPRRGFFLPLSLPAAGDLDGDGGVDLLLQEDLEFGSVFLAPDEGTLDVTDADAVVGSRAERSFVRSGAVEVGDLDGDGYDEAILEQGNQRSADRTTGRVQLAAGSATGPEDAVTGELVADGSLGALGGLTQVADLDGDGIVELLVRRTDGSVGVYYDVDPRAVRSLDSQDARFVATPENPVQSLDVAPSTNADATRTVALGFPSAAGRLYLVRVSGL